MNTHCHSKKIRRAEKQKDMPIRYIYAKNKSKMSHLQQSCELLGDLRYEGDREGLILQIITLKKQRNFLMYTPFLGIRLKHLKSKIENYPTKIRMLHHFRIEALKHKKFHSLLNYSTELNFRMMVLRSKRRLKN